MDFPSKTLQGERRWYDQKPELFQCINLLETFPAEIRSIIAEGVVYLAEREFDAHLALSSLKSLGPDKVLGIYKSKNKRRNWDKDPDFHKVMMYFYILSPENRLFMAKLTTDMLGYICQYFDACKIYQQKIASEDVLNITNRYIKSGGDEAQHLIETLQRQLRRQLQNAPQATPDWPTIQADETGMHLKKHF